MTPGRREDCYNCAAMGEFFCEECSVRAFVRCKCIRHGGEQIQILGGKMKEYFGDLPPLPVPPASPTSQTDEEFLLDLGFPMPSEKEKAVIQTYAWEDRIGKARMIWQNHMHGSDGLYKLFCQLNNKKRLRLGKIWKFNE